MTCQSRLTLNSHQSFFLFHSFLLKWVDLEAEADPCRLSVVNVLRSATDRNESVEEVVTEETAQLAETETRD